MSLISITTVPDEDGHHPEHAQADGLSCRAYLLFRLNAQRTGLPVLPKELAWERHRKADLHKTCHIVSGLDRMAAAGEASAQAFEEFVYRLRHMADKAAAAKVITAVQ